METKFKIGDDVMFSVAARQAAVFNADGKGKQYVPMRFAVTDLFTEQCYGGQQVQYNLRGAVASGDYSHTVVGVTAQPDSHGLFRAREIELEPYSI